MEKELIIAIEAADSLYVEKLFYEYNAISNILQYLAAQDLNLERFDKYFQEAIKKNVELELAKREVSSKYAPSNFKINNYIFNFNSNSITYIGEKKKEE